MMNGIQPVASLIPLTMPGVEVPVMNPGFFPSFQVPLQYYGEVPLQPPQPKEEKPKQKTQVQKFLRTAGGEVWEDPSLAEWSKDDHRLFVGNLGNEVTDDGLKRAFMQYKSLNRARVVRDKRNGKSRGFGFVSFLDPQDYLRALKEMNGKYVCNRPCKLLRSNWNERNLDTFNEKKEKKEKRDRDLLI
jgi:RNA recognition motif-containing protein